MTVMIIILTIIMSKNCNSQDTINKDKFLVIERINSPSGNPTKHQTQYKIKADRNVTFKTYNNIKIQGSISYITDSTILINGKQIYLSQIKKIRARRGTRELIIGASSTIALVGLMLFRESNYCPDFNENGEDMNSGHFTNTQIGLGCLAFTGGVITLIGIVEMTLFKYYNLDKNWELKVVTKDKK